MGMCMMAATPICINAFFALHGVGSFDSLNYL